MCVFHVCCPNVSLSACVRECECVCVCAEGTSALTLTAALSRGGGCVSRYSVACSMVLVLSRDSMACSLEKPISISYNGETRRN